MEKPLGCYFQVRSPYYQVAQCNQKTAIPVCSWWSNIKVRFSFNQPNRKEWGARLVDAVKHLPHKGAFTYYVITEGRGGQRSLNCLCMIIRPSQIACTVMTAHANGVTRARYWFLSVKIIWICQCVLLFFLPCAWLPSPLVHCVIMLATSLRCADFFVCFYRRWFCPAINLKVGFPFIFLCKREKYHWVGPLGSCINYTNMISESYKHVLLYQHIFHWKVETGLKHDFIMYNFLHGPQIVKTVNCVINLSQLRTTYHLSTQASML